MGSSQTQDNKIDSAAHRTGDNLERAAKAIRDNAPEQEQANQFATTVARKVDHAGDYLKQTDVQSFTKDCTNMIRRNPIQATLIGLGVGVLLAKAGRKGIQSYSEHTH